MRKIRCGHLGACQGLAYNEGLIRKMDGRDWVRAVGVDVWSTTAAASASVAFGRNA